MRHRFLSVLGLLIYLAVSGVQAQERGSYFGIGAAYSTDFGIVSTIGLFPSFQIGGPISDALELRGTAESIIATSNLGLELLYPVLSGADARLYLGGGANARLFFYLPVSLELHLVLGGEYFFNNFSNSGADLSPLGLFGEARIYSLGLFYGFPTLEGRIGVNFPL